MDRQNTELLSLVKLSTGKRIFDNFYLVSSDNNVNFAGGTMKSYFIFLLIFIA